MEYILSEFIGPTIVTLVALAVLYGLYRGLSGFWVDAAGQRMAALYVAIMPIVVIYLTIKLKSITDWPIWIMGLSLLGMFAAFFWTGRLLFPTAHIFGANDKDENNR